MSDVTNAATTSTLKNTLRARLREICTIEAIGVAPTVAGIKVSWSKWTAIANFNRDLHDPSKLRIVHIETAIKEAMDRLTQAVWDDYKAIDELMLPVDDASAVNARELQEAKLIADRLSARITKWIGAYGAELICPRAKRTPSPCAAIDGAMAVTLSAGVHPYGICVGCGESVMQIVRDETLI